MTAKGLLIALIVLDVLIPIALLCRAAGISFWPPFIFIFYFSACCNNDLAKLKEAAIGALIGIALSFSSGLVALVSSKGIGELAFLLLLFAFIALLLSGKNKYINNAGNLYLICLTAAAPEEARAEKLPTLLITFALSVGLCYAASRLAAKKRTNVK